MTSHEFRPQIITSSDHNISCEEDGRSDLHGPPWSNNNIKHHPKFTQVRAGSRHCDLTKKQASGYYSFS